MSGIGYAIGVDGGGTGCRARLRDASGALLGEGIGGPGNIRLGLEPTWANILAAIDGALDRAGLTREIFDRTAIGIGLAGIVDDASANATLAAGPSFARSHAASDAQIACIGAFSGEDGAILITGTGSAAYAWLGGTGTPMFGWGFEVDDKGSAAALGRSAVTAALDGRDGLAAESALTQAILTAVGGSTGAIVAWITAARPRDYGALAPIVFDYAQQGDRVALHLLRRCAGEVEAMLVRLQELGARRLCLVGGMAEHIGPWLTPWARAGLAACERDAADGAILMVGGRVDSVDHGRPAHG